MPEYVWIFDNRQGFKYVSYYLHSAKSLYKYSLQGTHYNEYLSRDRSIQNLIEDLRWRALSTFAANSILNFARYRVLNMSEFWIFVHFRKTEFWICVVMQLWKGSEYSRILTMPSVAQGSGYALIWLNNALWQGFEYVWSMFHRIWNMHAVLNMPELRIWGGCEYI